MLYKYDKNQLVFKSLKLKSYIKAATLCILAISLTSFYSYKLGIDKAVNGLTEYEKVVLQINPDFFKNDFSRTPELAAIHQLFENSKKVICFHGKTKELIGKKNEMAKQF